MENTGNVTLSAEEQKWLDIKRKEEELKREKEELERQEKILKATENVKAIIAKRVHLQQMQMEACKNFQKGLDSRWNFEEKVGKEEVKETTYNISYHPETGDREYTEVVLYKEEYERKTGRFTYGHYIISVKLVENLPNNSFLHKYYEKVTPDLYRMSLDGPNIPYAYTRREIKNPKAIDKKVTEVMRTAVKAVEFRDKYEEGVQIAMKEYSLKYPAATVVRETDMQYKLDSGYSRSPYQSLIVITFPNGIRGTVRIWSNLSRSITIQKLKVVDSDLDVLSTISFV